MAYKNRDMATGPFPVRVRKGECTWMTGPRVTRISYVPVAVLSDDTEVSCQHQRGHTSLDAYRACAIKLVDRLNEAAGIPKDKR